MAYCCPVILDWFPLLPPSSVLEELSSLLSGIPPSVNRVVPIYSGEMRSELNSYALRLHMAVAAISFRVQRGVDPPRSGRFRALGPPGAEGELDINY